MLPRQLVERLTLHLADFCLCRTLHAGHQRRLPQRRLPARAAVKLQHLPVGICRALHTGSSVGKSHLLHRRQQLGVGLGIRLEGEHPLAAAGVVHQLGDGVPAVGAKVGKALARGRAQNIFVSLLRIGFAVEQVLQFAAELKVDHIVQHLAGLLVGKQLLDLQKILLVAADKFHVEQLHPCHRHVGSHQLVLLRKGADALDGGQVTDGKRQHDDKVVVHRLHVAQLANGVAHEGIAACKIVAGKHRRRSNPVALHHLQNFHRAVPHAVHHHRFVAALQALPDVLFFCNPAEQNKTPPKIFCNDYTTF